MFVDRSFTRRFGIPRVRTLTLLFLAACLLAPGVALAYQLPLEGNHPDTMEHDLAAMTLRPDEYEVDGLAATDNHLMGPAWFAEHYAAEIGANPEELADDFDDAGLNAAFLSLAAVPLETDPDAYGIVTQSTAMEFDDEDGAETGFELMQIDDPDADMLEDPEVGAESSLARLESEEDGQGYVLTGLVFRVENIVGVVEILWIEDASESEPYPDDIIDAALEMEERITDVLDGRSSGLVMKLLRLDGTDDFQIRTDYDSVDIENGDAIQPYGVSEDIVGPVQELWEEFEVEQLHRVAISFVPEDDPENPGAVYISRIFEFGSRREARSFVDPATEFFLDGSAGSGYSDLEIVDDLPEFDGEIVVIGYAYDFGGDELVTGYRVWLQVDNYVIAMEADSVEGIDLDALLQLLEEQASCVEDEGYCQPIEVPDDLFS